MNYFNKIRELTHDDVRSLAVLCASAAVIIAVAVWMGGTPVHNSVAINTTSSSQTASIICDLPGVGCSSGETFSQIPIYYLNVNQAGTQLTWSTAYTNGYVYAGGNETGSCYISGGPFGSYASVRTQSSLGGKTYLSMKALTKATTFTLNCFEQYDTGGVGSAASVTWYPPPIPAVTLSVTPASISYGTGSQTATIKWNVSNLAASQSCYLMGDFTDSGSSSQVENRSGSACATNATYPVGPFTTTGVRTYTACYTSKTGGTNTCKSVTLNVKSVVPICTATQHLVGTTCVDNIRACTITHGTGTQTWNGTAWGTCMVVSCNLGYVQSGNTCIPQPSCPAHSSGTPCACDSGYTQLVQGGACTAILQPPSALPTIQSFGASLVVPNNSSTLSWNITGMKTGITCSIAPVPASGQIAWNGSATWTGTAATVPITHSMIYTLTCTNGTQSVSASATAGLLPSYQEI